MKKHNNRKGFTLAELLIVVAIIGVLTVVAVPIFTTQLEKSREATDIANLREAKAAAVAAYLGDETIGTGETAVTLGSQQATDQTVFFDASTGKLVLTPPTIGYGKGTAAVGDTSLDGLFGYKNTPTTDSEGCLSYNDLVIKVTVTPKGECSFRWVSKATTTT